MMASPDDNMKQMFDVWQEGQEAFFSAQKEMAQGMAQTFTRAMNTKDAGADADGWSAWQSFVKSWAPAWDPSAVFAAPQSDGQNDPAGFFKLLDPSSWMMQAPEQLRAVLETVTQGPQFADLINPNKNAAEIWQETLDFQQAAAAFLKVLQDAWARAYATYAKSNNVDDLKSGKVKEALDTWLSIANGELLETQRSQEFLEAQKKLLRAGTEIKRRQREQAETWCESYQIPTRTEIDDLTGIVHDLRAELRALRRELDRTKKGRK